MRKKVLHKGFKRMNEGQKGKIRGRLGGGGGDLIAESWGKMGTSISVLKTNLSECFIHDSTWPLLYK